MLGAIQRMVYRNEDGQWANLRVGSRRASSVHATLFAAVLEARRMLMQAGGGELTIRGDDGRIRTKDTIEFGNDPRWVTDREH